MFRWLALCLVLCAGAFALVAMATGAFNPTPPGSSVDAPAGPGEVDKGADDVQPAPNGGLGRGGALVLHDARLTAVEREEVPSQHDGTMLVVGTDDPGDPAHPGELLSPIRVPFLVIQIADPSDPKTIPPAVPENQWLYLVAASNSKFKEAVGQARLGEQWEAYKKSGQAVYRRWQEGDPLQPHKVEMAFEHKIFRKLEEGEMVKKDQLLALVDPTVQVNEVSSKVAKLETAEADYFASIKTKEEAIRRSMASDVLHDKGKGFISDDDWYAAHLNRDRYIEEEKSKDAARKVASEELSAAISILKLHEIRASIPGVIRTIYKHHGESVKNLDPVVQIQNPLRLRVEALVDQQDAQKLAVGDAAIVEPTRPTPPAYRLPGHQAEVTCVAVSRDRGGKKWIVSGSEDGTARFWDLTADQPLLAFLDHHAGVLAVACTGPKAEQNLALTGDRDGVGRLIDLDHLLPGPAAAGAAAGAVQTPPIKLSERHKGPITCVAFSPDGALCATGGEDRAIRLWAARDATNDADGTTIKAGTLLHTLSAAHKAAVTSLQFAQEPGKTLQLASAGGDNALNVWNIPDKGAPARAFVLPYRSGDVAHLGVSADGKYVLFDHGPELRVLSLADRQIEGVIQSSSAATNFTTMALFSPDGGMVLTNCASQDRLQLWRTPGRLAADGQGRAAELRQFVWNSGAATSGAFYPDDKQPFVVTGSRDNFVLVWPLPTRDEMDPLKTAPLKTKLTLVERALDAGARQVRVWAEVDNPDWRKPNGLTPGGAATLVIPSSRTADAR